ncbi:hypothetical protein MKX01_039989, partial [Papaver californicum]
MERLSISSMNTSIPPPNLNAASESLSISTSENEVELLQKNTTDPGIQVQAMRV